MPSLKACFDLRTAEDVGPYDLRTAEDVGPYDLRTAEDVSPYKKWANIFMLFFCHFVQLFG